MSVLKKEYLSTNLREVELDAHDEPDRPKSSKPKVLEIHEWSNLFPEEYLRQRAFPCVAQIWTEVQSLKCVLHLERKLHFIISTKNETFEIFLPINNSFLR